jgi:hypothetical protein
MSAEVVTHPAVGAEDRSRWLALAVIVTAQFMVVLDISIVNVALPSIKTDLHFRERRLTGLLDLLRRQRPRQARGIPSPTVAPDRSPRPRSGGSAGRGQSGTVSRDRIGQ